MQTDSKLTGDPPGSLHPVVGPTDWRTIIRVNDALKREHTMRSRLEGVRHQLATLAATLQKSSQVKYTGWNVLLKRDGDGWKCVGIVNPDKQDETPEDFDMTLPIPDPETIGEFDGW